MYIERTGKLLSRTALLGNRPLGRALLKRKKSLALERDIIKRALQYTGGNKAKAARLLQVDYKTIHTKVKKLGITIH